MFSPTKVSGSELSDNRSVSVYTDGDQIGLKFVNRDKEQTRGILSGEAARALSINLNTILAGGGDEIKREWHVVVNTDNLNKVVEPTKQIFYSNFTDDVFDKMCGFVKYAVKSSDEQDFETIVENCVAHILRTAFENQPGDEVSVSDEKPKDKRIDLLQLFLQNLTKENKDSYNKEELCVMFSNAIYLCLEGSHEERIEQMNRMDLPKITYLSGMLNCHKCGSPVRTEEFNPGSSFYSELGLFGVNNPTNKIKLWMCSNSTYFGGECDEVAYFSEEAWTKGQTKSLSENSVS